MLNSKTALSLLAGSLTLAAGNVNAATYNSSAVRYAAEGVASNATAVQMPTLNSPNITLAAGDILPPGSIITFTFVGGTIKTVAPSLTCEGDGCQGATFQPIILQGDTVSYSVVGALPISRTVGPAVLTFGNLEITNAAGLGIPNSNCLVPNAVVANITGSSTGWVPNGSFNLIQSCNATSITVAALNGARVDIATGALAFTAAAPVVQGGFTLKRALVGTITPITNSTVDTDGITAIPVGSLVNTTVTAGSMVGIDSMELRSPSEGSCNPAGTLQATSLAPNANTVTFATSPTLANGTAYCLYAVASGSSPMFGGSGAISNPGNPYSISAGNMTYTSLPGDTAFTATLGSLPFNGAAKQALYVVGANNLYNNYVAVTNPSFQTVNIYVAAVGYDGTVSVGNLGQLGPNAGTLYDSIAIQEATGGIPAVGQAAKVIFFSTGDILDVSNMLLNGGNMVTGIQ